MPEIMHDPEFWVSISVIIAVAFVVWKAAPMIGKALDSRADKIRGELAEAQRLREDAQRLLAEYQRKQRDGLKEAEQIVALARSEAERVAAEAAKDLDAARKSRLIDDAIAELPQLLH